MASARNRSRHPKRLGRTSFKPDRDTSSLRLLVEARSGDEESQREITRAVRDRLGKDAAGRAWKVKRMFATPGRTTDEELGRFFEVIGSVSASPSYPLQKVGFDIARGISEAKMIRHAQPDLPSSLYGAVSAVPVVEREVGFGFFDRDKTPLPGSAKRSWALDRMRVSQAWALPPAPGGLAKGAGIVVGHPDTGFTPHPEFETGTLDLTKDRDIINGDVDGRDPLEHRWWFPLDTPGHGTATGSVIVSHEAGELIGVAPLATLVPIRTVKSVVQVFDGDVAKAIEYARQIKCHIVSMSLGGIGFFPGLGDVILRAVRDGLIVMAAAGNHVGFVTAPANLPGCLAVAATNVLDAPWSGSSHGSRVDICAPGESVWAATVDWHQDPPVYSVGRHTGTSLAVAHLAGVASLWLAHHGRDALVARYGTGRIQDVFLHVLQTTGRRLPPGWDAAEYGSGIADALAMLQAPLPVPSAVPQPRPIAPSRPIDPIERVHALCPEVPAAEVHRRLIEMLGGSEATLGGRVERYGAEIAYLLAEDPAFRAAFVETPRGLEANAVGGSSMRRAILRSASRSLIRAAFL
jgi:hypothetical protein